MPRNIMLPRNGAGVLPRQYLTRLLDGEYIRGVDPGYLNPASIDLPISDEAYRLESIFLPLPGEHIRPLIEMVGGRRHDLALPLEVGVPYAIKIEGKWSIPESVYAYANPKSSTGRTNLLTRLVADGIPRYDDLRRGFCGEVWIIVRPGSFPVILSPGQALTQLRFFTSKSFLSPHDIEMECRRQGLLFGPDGKRIPYRELAEWQDALMLTISVTEVFGWESRGTKKLLDFGKRDHQPTEYFQTIPAPEGRALLRAGGFYILSTRERVLVPPHLSAELRATDTRLGEFRVHAAGYIDPGWGASGGSGRPITLEIIPSEDILVRDGQSIARIRYEHMVEVPEVAYDEATSNYITQEGPRLSKHFA